MDGASLVEEAWLRAQPGDPAPPAHPGTLISPGDETTEASEYASRTMPGPYGVTYG
jgi:hypothetical protein